MSLLNNDYALIGKKQHELVYKKHAPIESRARARTMGLPEAVGSLDPRPSPSFSQIIYVGSLNHAQSYGGRRTGRLSSHDTWHEKHHAHKLYHSTLDPQLSITCENLPSLFPLLHFAHGSKVKRI